MQRLQKLRRNVAEPESPATASISTVKRKFEVHRRDDRRTTVSQAAMPASARHERSRPVVLLPQEKDLRRVNERLMARIRGLEQHNRDLNLVQDLSGLLQACGSIAEMHSVIAQYLQKLVPVGSGALYLLNESVGLLELAAGWGEDNGGAVDFDPCDCWAVRRGHTHAATASSTSPRCPHLKDSSGISSICIPLVATSDVLGILSLRGSAEEISQPRVARDQTIAARAKLLEMVGTQIALAVANLKMREKLQAQSVRDPVSGLFNRRYLEETLTREVHRSGRDSRELSMLVCDLDCFKTFNDSYGHAAGDALLHAFGDLIQKFVRADDVACRYGGDEFVLILMNTTIETAKSRAELLQREFRQLMIPFGEHSLHPGTLSLGISGYPKHGTTASALFRTADQALYRAKSQGGDRIVVGPSATAAKQLTN